MDVNERILDAIELLANNSVQKAGYDKTIQAQILSCEDQVVGKYRCKYQDAVFYAYTNNPDIRLSKGTLVYILVPGNDMRQQKTIIGMVDKLGADYISAAVGDQAYNIIGSNVLSSDSAYYLDIDIADYSFDIYDIDFIDDTTKNKDYITLNVDELNQYIKQASSIIIGMNVKTDIPLEKQKTGSYGIKFSLEFKDDRGNQGIIRDYILDEDRMIDNPYNLIYPTRQYVIFDIDNQNFVRVKKITIFNKDFPSSTGESNARITENYQIELTDFELSCAVRMSQEELNGLGLSIISPRGLIFLNNTDEPKILQAQVKFKGRVVSSQNVQFYWGVEDLRVTPQSEGKYNKYLGRGWNCINEKSTIQPQGGAATIQWLSYGDTYEFPFSQALVRDNRVKVAAVYDGNVITKQVNVQNLSSSAGSIVINSSSGTEFYYGIGETLLQCVADIPGHAVASYAWGWQNNGGELQQFSTTVSTRTVEARYIYNFAIYRCSVYDNDGNCLGTASIKLSNSMQGEGTNPLVIQNGTVLYKYNEKGVSPTSRNLQNPQIIQQLRFKLYDDVGNEIQIFHDGLIDSRASVKWRVPANNTLLTLPDPPQTIIDNYYIVQNVSSLTYDLVDRYDPRKTINQIILQVTYDGSTSLAQTNLTFTKQGQIGTNGTDYYVNIIPNTRISSPPLFPMITKFSNGDYKLNYGLDAYDDFTINPILSLTPLLKVQFLHGGEPVSSGYTVKWRVLKNRYGTQNGSPVEDESDFTINQSTGIMTYTGNLVLNDVRPRANIIECEITYDSHTYYGAIPFITAYMESEASAFDLVDGTGFHYVMYSSEGMQPEYSSLPFEFTDGNNGTCTVLGNIRTYDNVNRNWNNYENSGDLIQNSQDPFKIQPIGFYKGECVNNSVRYQNSNGIINIPIHFYLNRYNFAHLNGWDGNSIQINEKDGYILAPQLGAGAKDANNRFTGVLMGQVKNPAKSQSDIGLFGYNQGSRSFFINSKNGSALFGNGNGQIIIDPGTVDNSGNVQNAKAMLYSHNFWLSSNYNSETGLPNSYSENQYADAGMLIDLTTPQIVFKNKMLHLTSDGAIYAGKRIDNNITYYNFSVDSSGNVQIAGDLKAGRISPNKYNFFVNNSAQIGRTPKDTLLQAGWDAINNKYNFTITADGDVSMAGDITANSGHIGGINGWTIGYNNDTSQGDIVRGYIYSGTKDSLNKDASGLYIGTDGISAYKSGTGTTFKVDSQGNVTVNGNITLGQGSSITWGALPNDVASTGDVSTAIDNAINDYDSTLVKVPSYIQSTYIDGKSVSSFSIYGGKFYATGQGYDAGAAYYIYDGDPRQSGATQIGYISYDTHGNTSVGDAQNRVLFTTLNGTALKILSARNMSFQAGTESAFQTDYRIYFRSLARLDCGFAVSSDYSYSTLDPVDFFSTGGWGYALQVQPGQVYFKIVNS